MAQCFVSTYRDHYRWQDPEVTPSCKPVDGFVTALPPEDIWIGTTVTDDEQDAKAVENRLHRRHLKRLITTYQVHYCSDMFADLLHDPVSKSFESQLLESSKRLFEPDSRPKIVPPSVQTRKMFGYIRPSRNYTPMTHYQFVISQTGYKILKGDLKKKELQTQNKLSQKRNEPLCACNCTKTNKE